MYVLHESSTYLCVRICIHVTVAYTCKHSSHIFSYLYVISYRTSNLHTHKSHHAFISFSVHYSGSLSYCKLSSWFVLTVLACHKRTISLPSFAGSARVSQMKFLRRKLKILNALRVTDKYTETLKDLYRT